MYNALVSGLDEFGKPSKQLVAEEGPTPDVQIQEPGLQEAQRAILAFYDELSLGEVVRKKQCELLV
jgi:hypothetical protein